MAPLLPSEVARLVYGQLNQCNCPSVAERFLNESPHLEECREFVKMKGKPSFMTKVYGLSLQQILEHYLDMWNLILDQTNNVIPDTQEKFADPVEALKFLLSVYSKTSDSISLAASLPGDNRWKTVVNNDNETSSDLSLRINVSPEIVRDTPNKPANQNHTQDSNHTQLNTYEFPHHVIHQNCSPLRLKKQNRYLDELYASTESLENPTKKRKLKVLKPRRPTFDRLTVSRSASQDPAVNLNVSEGNTKTFVHDKKSFASATTSKMKISEVNSSKTTSMQLRSFSKTADNINHETSGNKNSKGSKKRKCSCSPEREGGYTKQPKMNKLTSGKENDAQVDFTKIPQLLIDDPKWPELIAENINKKISESPQKKIDSLVEDKDNVIQSIAEKTLEDDLTDQFIRGLLSCAQNITQEKNSEVTDISLLDDAPYGMNLNCETKTAVSEVLEHGDVISKPVDEYSDSNNQTYGNTDYARLHQDMNEFVQFNQPKGNNVISSGQSDIILIEMTETSQITAQNSNNYLIENQARSVHSNYVICTTPDPLISNGNDLKDEIINLCSNSNNVEWNVQVDPSVVVTSTATASSTNTKLQICGPVTSPTKAIKRNYRPIAPKPISYVAISNEKNLQSKSKLLKKSKK